MMGRTVEEKHMGNRRLIEIDDHREGGDADGEAEEEVDHEGEER